MPPAQTLTAPASEQYRLDRAGSTGAAPLSAGAPKAPMTLEETGVEPQVLLDLALKLAYSVPNLTVEWAARQLRLPPAVVDRLLWQLKDARMLEVLGEASDLDYRYTVTQRGREQAVRLLEVSGYIGPAPVSLDSYTRKLVAQMAHHSQANLAKVRQVLSPLVLTDDAVEVAALAATSGRSLFLFGPSGNGKTSMGRLLHHAVTSDIWIPYCINVESSIIRIFDRSCHHPVDEAADASNGDIDQRWVRIKRPFIVAGGELTIDQLDLAFSPSLRYYEAPPHVKANCGTFLIDDLGRQQIDPHDLLNRWIVPLEHRIDYLTLSTGQKILIPFQLFLIVATNLPVSDVADPAFLRRMGYRLHLHAPKEEAYARIFHRCAEQAGTTAPPELIHWLLERYRTEKRDLRASEPRDLVERSRELHLLHHGDDGKFQLSQPLLERAWKAYFGH